MDLFSNQRMCKLPGGGGPGVELLTASHSRKTRYLKKKEFTFLYKRKKRVPKVLSLSNRWGSGLGVGEGLKESGFRFRMVCRWAQGPQWLLPNVQNNDFGIRQSLTPFFNHKNGNKFSFSIMILIIKKNLHLKSFIKG